VLAGGLFLRLNGAPAHYWGINLAAWLIGLAVAVPLRPQWSEAMAERASVVIATVILITACFGVSVEGASRWLALGPILIQPSLVLLPLLVLDFARRQTAVSAAAVMITAVALALQPDRAMSAMLAVACLVMLMSGRNRFVWAATLTAMAACVAAFLLPDQLEAVPFVEGVYQAAWASGGVDLWLVFGGTVALLLPACLVAFSRPDRGGQYLVFGAVWFTLIAAAALGNYPTPLLGYGSSAILGYALCFLTLPETPGRRIEDPHLT